MPFRVHSLPVALLACLAAGAAAAVLAGQDANWDLLNYHLYNGMAWLQGRSGSDLFVAGMQSTLNPVLDAIYAGLALGPLLHAPRVLAAVMGLWYGLLLYAAFGLAGILYGTAKLPRFVATVLGVTGVATLLQLGTTTGEVPAGAIMASGLLVLLRPGPTRWRAAAGGLLFGVAGGLKLTALAYAPAACLALAVMQGWRGMVSACLCFTAGWAAGFALADGWWALSLVTRFGSPVFPLFNGLFRSPWYPPAGVVDDRFFPHGLAWLFYPFTWTGQQMPGPSELPFRDLRFAAALGFGAAALLLRRPMTRPQRAALAFLAVGYVTWLLTSSILRYAVVLELMAGLSIPLLLGTGARRGILSAVALVALLATTQPIPSPRLPYGATSLQAEMGWVEPGMLIVVTFRGASAHVIAMMPERPDVEIIGVGTAVLEARGWGLHDAALRRVRAHQGRIVVVTEGNMQGNFAELGEIGLDPHLTHCRPFASSFVPLGPTGLHVCDATRREPDRMPSPFWAEAAGRYRTLYHPIDAQLSLVGATYLQAAGPSARGTHFIEWTDLLWSGVRHAGAPMPARLDPSTLYVAAPEHAATLQALVDPAKDAFGWVDGRLVAAPGWRGCTPCIAPARAAPPGAPLALGDIVPPDRLAGVLGAGWWPLDAGQPGPPWSSERAELVVPLADTVPDGATLVIAGRAFTAPGLAAQRVRVTEGGATTETLIAGEGTIAVRLHRADRLTIQLEFPDASSPAQLGLSADPRRLGFAPTALWLQP